MKIEVIDYDPKLHENFVKSYLTSYLSHGFIYDLSPDERGLIKNKILYNLNTYLIKVSVDANDPSKFLGFIIYEDSIVPTLLFIYVKKEYQRLGIGTKLLNDSMDFIISEVQVPMKTPNLNFFLRKLKLRPLLRFYQLLGL
jgi:ribosomal protein S18 acetylase RimI-like enzyme